MRPRHLYVHVPFCARRCAYCDFSIAVRREIPVEEYCDATARELALRYPAADRWTLDTLYLGGGTPSSLGGEGVAALLRLVGQHTMLEDNCELTLEANPDDVTPDAARAWASAGVNRVSLGSQSFSDAALRWMHRGHDAAAIPRAMTALRDAGIANVSVDLIFALPDAVPRDWREDLQQAISLEPTHLSLYGLTFEHATPLARWRERGNAVEADEERYAEEFLLAHEMLESAGFEHYEISSFARPGFRSRHNSSYWVGSSYAGVGPSAHAFENGIRRWNVRPYAEWLRRVRAGLDPEDGSETLSDENRLAEAVYLGLRTTEGMSLRAPELSCVDAWVDAGWARLNGHHLALTPAGWLRMDTLAAALTFERSRCII